MRRDARKLEAQRLNGLDLDSYPWFHERHRVFPAIFEQRGHQRILDIASGVGIVARRIEQRYSHDLLVCNDISSDCLRSLRASGFTASCFDLDDENSSFPFGDGSFDAVIALATIEHLLHGDHFLKEVRRLLNDSGYLYLSAPNYSGLAYVVPLLVTGRTFHNPLDQHDRYEFYAHVRYFTYRTLLEYVSSFGFKADTVYVPLPEGSAKYKKLCTKSRRLGALVRLAARVAYAASPRWASEPVICFAKNNNRARGLRRVLL